MSSYDPYAILGLSDRTADDAAIKRACRQLLLRHELHPDFQPADATDDERALWNRAAARITRARDDLLNPARRAAIDLDLSAAADHAGSEPRAPRQDQRSSGSGTDATRGRGQGQSEASSRASAPYTRRHPRPRTTPTKVAPHVWDALRSIGSVKNEHPVDVLTAHLDAERALLQRSQEATARGNREEMALIEDALWERQNAIAALIRAAEAEAGADGFGSRSIHPHHAVDRIGLRWLWRDPTGMCVVASLLWAAMTLWDGAQLGPTLVATALWAGLISLRPIGRWRDNQSWPLWIGLVISIALGVHFGPAIGYSSWVDFINRHLGWAVLLAGQALVARRSCHTPLDDVWHAATFGPQVIFWSIVAWFVEISEQSRGSEAGKRP